LHFWLLLPNVAVLYLLYMTVNMVLFVGVILNLCLLLSKKISCEVCIQKDFLVGTVFLPSLIKAHLPTTLCWKIDWFSWNLYDTIIEIHSYIITYINWNKNIQYHSIPSFLLIIIFRYLTCLNSVPEFPSRSSGGILVIIYISVWTILLEVSFAFIQDGYTKSLPLEFRILPGFRMRVGGYWSGSSLTNFKKSCFILTWWVVWVLTLWKQLGEYLRMRILLAPCPNFFVKNLQTNLDKNPWM